MKDEINKIINWIEMGYTRLNYKEELLLVNYIKQLQKENQKYKEVIEKAIEYIESKNNGHCIINGEEKGAFTFILNFDAGREFIWKLLDILKGETNE